MNNNIDKRFVYADNAATTQPSESVINAMLPYLTTHWGNPSSQYSLGSDAASAVSDARERIAAVLGAGANQILFTSCGSEADNWAIKGTAMQYGGKRGKHIISTEFEHPAVLNTLKALKKDGFEVTLLKPDSDGIITPESLKAALEDRDDTLLVAVMAANNEIGTVQPIRELCGIAHAKGAFFFTDAVQAVGSIEVNVKDWGVDMLAMSGHKLNAPKGIGALYVRKGLRLRNLIDGGGQEKRRRAGTENVPYIVGLAQAMEDARAGLPDMERVKGLRDRLARELTERIPKSFINGTMDSRLPGNLNIAFEAVEGESLLLWLDLAGICVSTGSACSSETLEPSHVLLSIGVPVENAHGSLRFSLSHCNTDADVDYIVENMVEIVAKLRSMSPIWQ